MLALFWCLAWIPRPPPQNILFQAIWPRVNNEVWGIGPCRSNVETEGVLDPLWSDLVRTKKPGRSNASATKTQRWIMNWTSERTEILNRLAQEELDYSTIARILKTSEKAVIAKLTNNNPPAKPIQANIAEISKFERLQRQRAMETEYIDNRDFTAQFMGDPVYVRSALFNRKPKDPKCTPVLIPYQEAL